MKKLTKYAFLAVLTAGAVFVLAPRARAAAAAQEQAKTLTGSVLDKSDAPLGGAVVYLKNTKTLAVKSYITDDAGNFRFNALSPNADYEVYAEFNGARSNTKTVSSFDSRKNVNLSLKIDVKK